MSGPGAHGGLLFEEGGRSPPAFSNPYAGYETWKRWDALFTYSHEDARYFAGETQGLTIACGDVLEIGFGAGGFLAWARDRNARVAGVEIIPALIEAALQQGVDLLPPDFERVAALHPARFDTVVAFDVFEHLPAAQIVAKLGALDRMLKTGGHIILRFPNGQSPFGLAPQNGDPTHQGALSRSVFERLMHGLPFEPVRYAPAFRVTGGGISKTLARRFRYLTRDLISAALNAVYTQEIPWDPVVVLVLRKIR